MKAVVLRDVGDFRVEDVPQPQPKAGEALVRIRACGVCGSDLPRIFAKGTYRFPCIPGHEFAGEVQALGEGVDAAWLHKRVTVFPLLPCRRCDSCLVGEYAMCSDYDYFGSRRDGGFAEYLAVPVWNLVEAPPALSFEEAAMTEPAAVAAHALRRAGVEIGDRVAVFGAGPIGLLLAQWARAWGAYSTMLVDVDAAKLEFAQKHGFGHTIDAQKHDAVQRIYEATGNRGADVAVEGAGVSETLEQCLRCVRPFGRVVAMGNPAGDMRLSQKGYWELLRKQLRIEGTWNSSYAPPKNDWQMALAYMAEGRLQAKELITHRFSLDAAPEALRMMQARKEFYTKVMFIME